MYLLKNAQERQGHLPLEQVSRSPMQPGLEHFLTVWKGSHGAAGFYQRTDKRITRNGQKLLGDTLVV